MSYFSERLIAARSALAHYADRFRWMPPAQLDALAEKRGTDSPHTASRRLGLTTLADLIRISRPASFSFAAPSRRSIVATLVLCGAFYCAARIGLVLHFPESLVYFVWPPSAILFVALVLSPRRNWGLFALALLPVHLAAEMGRVAAPLSSLLLFYGIVWLQALVGAWFVGRFAARPLRLTTLHDVIVFLLGGAGAAALTEALALATVLWMTAGGTDIWLIFAQTLFADTLTMLVLAPALVTGWAALQRIGSANGIPIGGKLWLAHVRSEITARLQAVSASQVVEVSLLSLGLLGTGLVAFGGYFSVPGALPALLYTILPLLLWAAVRFGLGITSLALCGLTLLSIVFAIHGRGPFGAYSTTENLFALQLFFIAISVPLLILAVLMQERRTAKDVLEQSELRYRDLVESQPDMICRYLPDSTLTFVNEAYCRAFGKPRNQLIGTKFVDFMDDASREHHAQCIAALLANPLASVDEHETMLPNGSRGWQQWVDHAICDANGNLVEVQAVGRDITDRKRAEDALHESEARFRAAFESAATGMMLVDATGRPFQVNRPLAEMLGYTQDELLTRTFTELTYPEDIEGNLSLFKSALAGEIQGYQLEKRFIHKQGHLVWGFLSAGVVRDAAGQPLYMVGQLQDITERKRAEEALRASEERYRAVLNNLPHGVVLLFDHALRHVFADGQGLPDIGLSKARIAGKTIWEVFPPTISATLAPRYQAALAGTQAAFDLTHEGRTYQTHMLPIEYGGTTAGMAVLQDVTEQRRVEVLAELDRTKTAFFSNVSHEFRTPLTLLLGPAADALADLKAPLPPRQRQRLELILRGSQRLHKLVNTLLEFSRIEAGRVQATYEPTDVAALTADLASSFRSAAESAGLQLIVNCSAPICLRGPVYVDREMWEKIVLNLVSNALKFTFEGSITVAVNAAGQEGEWVELEVRDTGTGIQAEELPHLFERFHRVQGARARTYEGSGIGLSLVEELVKLHSGTVRVTSAVGVGSTFTVSIPTGDAHLPADRIERQMGPRRAQSQTFRAESAALFTDEAMRWIAEPEQAQPSMDSQHTHTGTETILVADDNADMRTYLATLLGERWDVRTAGDGLAALAEARARPPDLVLADVMMPGLDGFALVAALREDPSTDAVPVILLSARAGVEATVEGLHVGADDYLIKPFSAGELLARVQTHLELSQRRKEAAARAAQLDAIFEAIGDGVLVHDLGENKLHANRAFRDLLRRRLEMRGQSVDPETLLLAPAVRERYTTISDEHGREIPREEWPSERALRGETLTGANAVDEFTEGPGGEILQVNVSAAPVRSASGQITGAVAVFRDVTERRRLERQVVEQASQLQAVFDAMTDGVFVFGANGRATRINSASRAAFGYVPGDCLMSMEQTPAQALVPRETDEQPLPDEQLPTERVLRGEVLTADNAFTQVVHAPDGHERTMSLTGGPLRDATGQITGGVIVARDVTELKRTQTMLAQQERLFRTLVENSPDTITRFDRNLRHLYVSPSSESLTGVPAQARLGKTYVESGFPEAASAPWEHALRRVFTTGKPQTFESNYHAEDRPPHVSRVSYVPEFAADGSVASALCITTDITKLKQVEEALRQSEERFSKAFRSSPIAMIILSRATQRILDANVALSRLTGFRHSELLGATLLQLRLLSSSASSAFAYRKRVSREGSVIEIPFRIRTKSGEIRSCLSSTASISVDGEPCTIMSIRDVTERERAEKALIAARAMAEDAQRDEARRRRDAERREQIAESLRDVLTILNSDRQVAKILDYITRQAGRLLSSEAAAIYMTASAVASDKGPEAWATPASAEGRKSLVLQAAFGLPAAFTSSGKHRLSVGDAAVHRAMVTRRPVAVLAPSFAVPERAREGRESAQRIASIESVETEALAGDAALAYVDVRHEPLPAPHRALLAVPIVTQGQTYGSLLLLYTEPRNFSADEVALAMAYGDQIALAVANAHLQGHIERAAIEAERNRLARELHDTVTQEIFTASMLAESIPQVWEQHREEAEANLRQVHRLTRGALAALRALLLELRPAVLEQKTLADLLRQLGEAMTTRSGVPIALTLADDCPPIPIAVKIAFYRIAQEALMNAAKYANAQGIAVRLRYLRAEGAIQLEVQDDGQGFDMGAIPAGHFGIGMMRERARSSGVSLRITSRRQHGTRVAVKWREKTGVAATRQGDASPTSDEQENEL